MADEHEERGPVTTETCKSCGYARQEHDAGAIGVCPKCAMPYAWNTRDRAAPQSPAARRARLDRLPARLPPALSAQENGNGRLEAVVGATLMIAGAFAPLVSVPMFGSINYVGDGSHDGIVIIALALLSVALAFWGRIRGLIITGGLSVLLMATSFYRLSSGLHALKETTRTELAGNPFAGLARAAVSTVQLQWGWVPLIAGAALLIAAGLGMRLRKL